MYTMKRDERIIPGKIPPKNNLPIETCAAKGMRLPTIFETTGYDTNPPVGYPSDGSEDDDPNISTAANGIPHYSGDTWTATTRDGDEKYWVWNDTVDNNLSHINDQYVRCVIP